MIPLEEMTLCAVRYCLGRSSYVIADVCRWVRTLPTPSKNFVIVCVRDIKDQLERDPNTSYAKNWLDLIDYLLKLL